MIKKILATVAILLTSVSVSSATIFSVGQSVSSVDRTATFDGLTTVGIDLSNYSEDSMFVTVPDTSFVGSPLFLPNDPRDTQFHYGFGGNTDYVSIRATDGAVFFALDFLVGNGNGQFPIDLRWESYLNGGLVDSANEIGLANGLVVGWSDLTGIDELRVAAGATFLDPPGFGNAQAIAIDDLRVQISPVPLPAAAWLFISALGGLVVAKRKQLKA